MELVNEISKEFSADIPAWIVFFTVLFALFRLPISRTFQEVFGEWLANVTIKWFENGGGSEEITESENLSREDFRNRSKRRYFIYLRTTISVFFVFLLGSIYYCSMGIEGAYQCERFGLLQVLDSLGLYWG